ncbi:MAG TPA: hypothetical protein VE910_03460, partial [Dongiaceae bacterium]|nr:hypothetical protein [Dongiaceae bacterium]
PVTQARVLWHGTYCDDVACPPGMTVTQTEDLVTQLALPGAHASGRVVGVGSSEVGTTVVMIDTTQQKLLIKAVDVYEAVVSLDYPESPQAPGLSIDFTSGGADALALEISGDGLDGSATVTCWLQVSSVNVGEQHGQNVQAPGLVIFPFDTFSPELDFSRIDRAFVAIGVTGSADLTIGPVHSVASSTPAVPTSWGALKSRYR